MSSTAEIEFKDYYVEKVYLSANVETGVLFNRSGSRMIALTNDFLIGLHRALERECGDRVSKVLYHCGRKWGMNFGKGLSSAWSEFYQCPFEEFPLAFFQSLLMQEFRQNGWGLLTLDYRHINQGVILLSLEGAIMSEILAEKPDYPSDLLTAGILAGMFTQFLSKEISCLQTQVASDVSRESRFLLSDPQRIEATQQSIDWKQGERAMLDSLLKPTS